MLSIYIFSLILVLISGSLITWHVVAWKGIKQDPALDRLELDFAWRQCRRRSQASGMIGLVGIGLAVYRWIPLNGMVVTVYILGLAVLAIWVMLLAIVDLMATRIHYHRLQRREMKKQTPQRGL